MVPGNKSFISEPVAIRNTGITTGRTETMEPGMVCFSSSVKGEAVLGSLRFPFSGKIGIQVTHQGRKDGNYEACENNKSKTVFQSKITGCCDGSRGRSGTRVCVA